MLQARPKKCDGCGSIKLIWKKWEGQRFCKDCWSCHSSKDIKKPTPRKPLSPKSSKQQKKDAAYSVLRAQYLKNNPHCQARIQGCTLVATDIHHVNGRVGELMLDDSQFIGVCRSCHTFIHEHPRIAKHLGLYHTNKPDDDI